MSNRNRVRLGMLATLLLTLNWFIGAASFPPPGAQSYQDGLWVILSMLASAFAVGYFAAGGDTE